MIKTTIIESPYDKKLSDIHSKMRQVDDAPTSNIPTKTSLNTITIDGKYKDLKKEAWISASDVAKSLGANKIFCAKCDYYAEFSMSDHSWSESDDFTLCFYASDADEAKDMLDTFKAEHDWSGTSLNLTHKPFSRYQFSDIREITKAEAESIIASQVNRSHRSRHADIVDHILYLPTRKILSEMKRSIDWAMNALKNMKDADEKAKRETWLKTPNGQAWKQLYDQEQILLKKLDAWNQKKAAKDQNRAELEKQREQNASDILECFDGKSTKYPQYNGHFIPVTVVGGKKFQGKGYLTAIEYKETSFSRYDNSEWDEAILFCPLESTKFNRANLKYCKIDDSVDASKLSQMKESYYEEKVESTKEWCRRKDPTKSEGEISKWAANIVKKYVPEIDIKKYFGIDDLNAEKAKSTAEWACNLPDASSASKAEFIIMRALQKKGIDPIKYKDLIAPIVIGKFGKTEKFK